MPAEPVEARILEEVRAALAAVREGTVYHYTIDAAYLVLRPQMRYLGEHRTVALVHPGGAIYEADTSCQTRISADFYVTIARKSQGSELPWEGDYEPLIATQLRLAEDVKVAIHGKQFAAERVFVFLTDRDVLGTEADGWAVAQAQLSYELNVAD